MALWCAHPGRGQGLGLSIALRLSGLRGRHFRRVDPAPAGSRASSPLHGCARSLPAGSRRCARGGKFLPLLPDGHHARSPLIRPGRLVLWTARFGGVNKVLAFLWGKGANIRSVTLVRRKPGRKAPRFPNSQTQEKSPAGIEKEADMKTTSAISTAALLAWMLVGLSSWAQEPVSPSDCGEQRRCQ